MLKLMQDFEMIIYQSEYGKIKIDVKLNENTVWLTQSQIAELFDKATSTINEHIKNIYEEEELEENTTMRKFGNSEFYTKPTNYYNKELKKI